MALTANEGLLAQFERYLLQTSLSPKTIENYLADLGAFIRWASGTYSEDFLIVQVKTEQIRAYITHLLDDLGRAPSTVNRHLQALRKCCSFLVAFDLSPSNAADEIALVSVTAEQTPKTLTQTEIDLFLKAANGTRVAIAKRDAAILQLLVNTGLRVTELVNLKVDDVVFDHPGVHLRIQDSRNLDKRNIPLPGQVCRMLKEYLLVRPKTLSSEHVFLTQEGNPLSTRTVQRIVNRCSKQAGVSGVTAQLLRRTYAMHLLQETKDLVEVSQRLGHQSLEITLRYLNLSESDKASLGFVNMLVESE